MTYRPLSTQRSLGHSASTRRPEPPSWRCVARAVPDPSEPKHFARSRRDTLVGAAAGMFSCVGDRRRSRAKIPRIQVLGAEARATGARPFSRIRSWTLGTLNSESEPECFPGAGARAVQNYPGSASQILAKRCHSCGLESSWPLGALPAAQPPPG